jgi:hypothetical protein
MKLMTSFKNLSLLILIMGILLFVSCKKEDAKSNVDEVAGTVESVEDENLADNNFDGDIDQSLDLAASKNPDLFSLLDMPPASLRTGSTDSVPTNNPCANITLSPDTLRFPITVTIDFGAGCVGADGRKRAGQVIIVFTDRMKKPGSTATTTFNNYFVDSVKVEGKHILTNMSVPDTPKFKREVIDGKLIWPSGRWILRSANKKVEMLNGMKTRERADDIFSITGEASGKNSREKTWTSKITTPLEKRGNWRWFVKGIVAFERGASKGSLDYGNGELDAKATLTINGQSKEITLR